MKVVLFCGGQGMRMREFSDRIPKPLVPLGSRPILWHLMKYYAHYGHNDFILCLGYKGESFKEYFLDYKEWLSNDFVLSDGGRDIELLNTDIEDWKITFCDTGANTSIGERLLAVRDHLHGEDMFLANYADGLTDLELPEMVDHFRRQDKTASFLVTPPLHQSFHIVQFDGNGSVVSLQDAGDAGVWVNAGFFVFKKRIFDFLRPGEDLVAEPFDRLIAAKQLTAFRYSGFWAGIDTWKDRLRLDQMMHHGTANWQVWQAGTE